MPHTKKAAKTAALSIIATSNRYGQFGRVGLGVCVRYAIRRETSERSGLIVTDALMFASARQGRTGLGDKMIHPSRAARSERSGTSETLLLTFPVVPIQQEREVVNFPTREVVVQPTPSVTITFQ